MKKLIPFFILLFSIIIYSQEVLDKMELRNGQVIMGKVEKIKTDMVDFKEAETDLVYETMKRDIRLIQLANGKILTFEEYQTTGQNETQTPQQTQQPIIIEKDDGPSTGLIILAAIGGVLLVLLLIGAAAQ
ncbi:MAG: hypothetical protein D8M26_13555 [Ignavibacteriae bacterium]|nr:hypothetical protein [Ignavibacteriota bacterium]MCE7855101.1 hypothetical protein [Ignavibacteria bacterium CHB3]GJQ44134.1 MAG: hypothetical protein JETCAE03_36320 [Ignavibacteriaceae bacterium]